MVDWPHCFGPVVKQNIMAGTRGKKMKNTYLMTKKQKKRREPESHKSLQGHTPNDPKSPARYHLLKVPLPRVSTTTGTTQTPLGSFNTQTIAVVNIVSFIEMILFLYLKKQ
jgi:hypothetical protein